MAENDSVFKPLTPEQMNGPFSGFLNPTHGQQQTAEQGPPVLAGKGTSLGFIANKFIQGAMEGRIKAFEKSENEKWQRYQGFTGFVNNLMPYLTTEGHALILPYLSQMMGGHLHEATGKGTKGQKQSADTYPSAGGKVLSTGNASAKAEGQGVMGHITNALRDMATGMTGGKTPKGGPDVGNAQAEISAKLFDENGQIRPEFNRSGVVQANLDEANRIFKTLPPGTTLAEAERAVEPQKQKLLMYAPQQWQGMDASMKTQFRVGPQTDQEDLLHDAVVAERGQNTPAGTATGQPQPNVGPPGAYAPNVRSMGQPAAPPPTPGPTGTSQAMGTPGPPNTLLGQARESLYGKRERVNLENPAKSGEHVAAEWNPRLKIYEEPGTGKALSPEQQKWLKVTSIYHAPPHNPIHKMNEVRQPDGTYRTQVYNDQTGKYEVVPGVVRIPEHEMAKIMALERRDEHFADRKLELYRHAADQIHAAERFWDSKRDSIERSQDTNLDKPKELEKNEGLRAKELKQINGDRDLLVTQLASSYKKDLDLGDKGGADKPVALGQGGLDLLNTLVLPGAKK